jgi:hypothetical protein
VPSGRRSSDRSSKRRAPTTLRRYCTTRLVDEPDRNKSRQIQPRR